MEGYAESAVSGQDQQGPTLMFRQRSELHCYSPLANAAMCGGIVSSREVLELPPDGAGVLNQA